MPTQPLSSIGQQTDIILARILYRGDVPYAMDTRCQAAQGGRKMNLVDQTISNPAISQFGPIQGNRRTPEMMP